VSYAVWKLRRKISADLYYYFTDRWPCCALMPVQKDLYGSIAQFEHVSYFIYICFDSNDTFTYNNIYLTTNYTAIHLTSSCYRARREYPREQALSFHT
jgi:hypothetical protein